MKNLTRQLLVIEDDPGLQSQLRWCFEGFDVTVAGDRESALAAVESMRPPVVTLDLGLPPDPANASEGLAVLESILVLSPYTKVIVVTGNDDQENAVRAVGLGAYDFYQKPIDVAVLNLIVERAFHLYELEELHRKLITNQSDHVFHGVVASSPKMLAVRQMVERVAPTGVTILLVGESGTGKEVFARAIHQLSDRRDQRMVAINCASIPENLLESELFGYEKGAFTGAVKQTLGKIEHANGGTLFLDEAGDLPLPLQAKLLRFLQERVIERLGGHKEIEVDVRVICATNQNLKKLIEEGRFREDLYYRFNEIEINIPPLRERGSDISLIARSILNKYNQQFNRHIDGFTKEALAAIEAYPWPGNVRELENKLKRAVIMEEGTKITPQSMELAFDDVLEVPDCNLQKAREMLDFQIAERALAIYAGNVSKAAEAMGISRPTLYAIMEKNNLKV